MINKIGKINIFSLVLFFLLANFITFPLIFNLTSLATGWGDEILIAWNHGWVIHSLLEGLPGITNIFNANIYFPYNNTLAFSDTYFTNSLIAIVPVLILKSPIVANNVNLIISLTLVGFFTFKLCQYLTKNNFISLLSGALMIFSPAFLAWLVHLQIISIYFVPLSILFLIKYLHSRKQKFLVGFLITFLLQIYNSFLPGFFIIFASLIILFFYFLDNKKNYIHIFSKSNLILVFISCLLIAIIAIPYFKVSKEFNYVRDIRDSIHFALQPEDFFLASGNSRLNPILAQIPFTKDFLGKGELKPGFLGAAFSILVILSFIYTLKNWKKQNFVVKGLLAAAVLGLLLSLGPFLHLHRFTIHKPFPIPLPYALFYYVIPGFQGFRNSARFEIMFMIFSLPIIAIYLKELFSKVKVEKLHVLISIVFIFVVLEFNFPLPLYSIPQVKDFPKVYTYLSVTPKSTVIVHMPIYNWNVFSHVGDEFWREYYSTLNFRRMVNGFSGFSPPPWQNLVNNLLAEFPSDASIWQLKHLGVNLVIVHKKEYDVLYEEKFEIFGKRAASGSAIIKYLQLNNNLVLEKQIEDDYVFKIK